jgi:hypothetical protein
MGDRGQFALSRKLSPNLEMVREVRRQSPIEVTVP